MLVSPVYLALAWGQHRGGFSSALQGMEGHTAYIQQRGGRKPFAINSKVLEEQYGGSRACLRRFLTKNVK